MSESISISHDNLTKLNIIRFWLNKEEYDRVSRENFKDYLGLDPTSENYIQLRDELNKKTELRKSNRKECTLDDAISLLFERVHPDVEYYKHELKETIGKIVVDYLKELKGREALKGKRKSKNELFEELNEEDYKIVIKKVSDIFKINLNLSSEVEAIEKLYSETTE